MAMNRDTLDKHLKAIHNHLPDTATWESNEYTCNEVSLEEKALQERDREFIDGYDLSLSFALSDFTPGSYPKRGDQLTYKAVIRRVLDTQITPDSQELRTHLGARYQR